MNEVLPKLSTSTCLSTLFVDCARSLLHPQTLPLVLCCRRQRTPMLCRMKPFWEVPRPVRPASVFTVLPTSLHRQLSVVTSAMLSASILQLLLIIVIYTELSLQLQWQNEFESVSFLLIVSNVDRNTYYDQRLRKVFESGGQTMASAECEPITGIWGQRPQQGPLAEPLVS